MSTFRIFRRLSVLTLGVATFALTPGASEAQLPQASARALGMGFNMTASARGFAAVANNPAGLAHWESPGFSIAIPSVAVGAGLGPIRLSDLEVWQGSIVAPIQKELWLRQVQTEGGQGALADAGVTAVALNVGPVGFQLSTSLAGSADLNPDAVELLLYGNAGRTGRPSNFELSGSSLDAFVLTTAALSYGIRASDRLYLGVTGKYVMGNVLLMGRDAGSTVFSDPLGVSIDFPVVSNSSDNFEANNGTGFGFDVGAIWEGPGITVGATVQNVVNTFAWTTDALVFRPGQAVFDFDNSSSDFEEQPLDGAPPELLDMVDQLTLKPVFSVGAEIDLPMIRLQADIRRRVSGGMQFGPEFHAGVGAELKALPFLPVRAHAAAVTGGVQFGGGASLILGPVNLTTGAAYQTGDLRSAVRGHVALSFGWN
jgi:hypothetical protein